MSPDSVLSLARRAATIVLCAAGAIELTGCGGGGAAEALQPARIVLGASVAHVGTTNACALPGAMHCLRAPATSGNFVSLAQSGNAANFTVTSADPSVATGVVVMQGPGGRGEPAVQLVGQRAGSTTLTISGANGATASLPVTVTTISALTVTLNNLPTVTTIAFTVSTPAGVSCPGFEGGYTFLFGPLSPSTVLENFPAMGAGPLDQCLFSTVEAVEIDASGATIVDKVFHPAIALGHDNPTTFALP
jgi:hypothetical protein